MKKRLALLLGVMLILVAAFASCGQTTATDMRPRWAESETHTFKITLADFNPDGSTLFNNYVKTFSRTDEEGKVTETKLTCYKDDVISAGESTIIYNSDQLCPDDVSGTYTLTIQENTATTWKVETKQLLFCQYERAKLQALGCLEKFVESPLNVTSSADNPFENNEGRITLRSESASSAIFSNDGDQLPVSATSENNGYYIGKTAQVESNYKYETTYDIANKKVTVKKDGGEAEERSLDMGNAKKCIDAAQLLLYVRSLDKSDDAFQDTPSVLVYDVTTNTLSTAAFTLTRQMYLKLDNADTTETIVSVNAVNVTVGSMPFIAQYNLPDVTGVDNGYDFLPISGGKRSRYTTIKFRSGWYSYQLQPDDEYKQTLDAVKVKG